MYLLSSICLKILFQYWNSYPMPMLLRHLACLRHDQSAIPTVELLTVSNLSQGDNNEINFPQEFL